MGAHVLTPGKTSSGSREVTRRRAKPLHLDFVLALALGLVAAILYNWGIALLIVAIYLAFRDPEFGREAGGAERAVAIEPMTEPAKELAL
jgi:hypothetical protein